MTLKKRGCIFALVRSIRLLWALLAIFCFLSDYGDCESWAASSTNGHPSSLSRCAGRMDLSECPRHFARRRQALSPLPRTWCCANFGGRGLGLTPRPLCLSDLTLTLVMESSQSECGVWLTQAESGWWKDSPYFDLDRGRSVPKANKLFGYEVFWKPKAFAAWTYELGAEIRSVSANEQQT